MPLVVAVAGCTQSAEFHLDIRLPADHSRLDSVTQLKLTATQNGTVLATSTSAASSGTVTLRGVNHGSDLVIGLDGFDDSGFPIARGRTCPVDYTGEVTAPLYFAPINFWAPTATAPSVTRYTPVALPRDDGTVVVTGGDDGAGAVYDTTELFAPGTIMFAGSSASLAQARTGAQAVALSGIGILVVGGLDANGTPVADAELYSETQGAFLTLSSPRLDGRVGHGIVALADGSSVLVTGGSNARAGAALATTLLIEVNSDGTSRVTVEPSLVEARREHAITLANKVPIVFGGYGAAGTPLDSIEAFDGTAWKTIGHLRTARAQATATVLSGGSVLVVGGVDAAGNPLLSAEIYNPVLQTTTVQDMVTRRYGHSATPLSNDRVLVAGGVIDGSGTITNRVEMLRNGVFVDTDALDTARAHHAAVSLCDETVLILGGGSGAEIYSPPAN